jgi:hypothetical protein
MMRSPRRYESAGRGPPIAVGLVGLSTCSACASIEEWTATVRIASLRLRLDDATRDLAAVGDRIFSNKRSAPGNEADYKRAR